MRFARNNSARRCGGFSPVTLSNLEEYSWPGNVRELENVVQRAVVMADGPAVELWHLPKRSATGWSRSKKTVRTTRNCETSSGASSCVFCAGTCDGSKSEAARRLGIARGYLHRLINQLRIEDVPEESFAESPELDMPVM